MNSLLSCNQIAEFKLLTFCQFIDDSEHEQDNNFAEILDQIKSFYAAKLIICEIYQHMHQL